MDDESVAKSTKVASKPVRVSAELASFLEEACATEQLKQSEMMDRIFKSYIRQRNMLESGRQNRQTADTLGTENDGHLLKVLAELGKVNQRLEALGKEKHTDHVSEKQNDTFELLNRQMKGLTEATQKYSTLHNYISLSTTGIKEGLGQAEHAIEKVLARTDEAVKTMEDLLKSQQEATQKSMDAATEFANKLDKLKVAFNTYADEEIRQPTVRLLKEIEAETKSDFRRIRLRSNIALGGSAIAMVTLAIFLALSYSPLSTYAHGLEQKYRAFHDAYSDLRGRVCAIKSNAGVKELQEHLCRKK